MDPNNVILHVPNYLDVKNCRALYEAYSDLAPAAIGRKGQNPFDASLQRVAPFVTFPTCCGIPPVDLRELREDIRGRVAARWGFEGLHVAYSAYTRCTAGGRHDLHADSVTLEGEPNHTHWYKATALVYLTPAGWEFDGGELLLPGLGLKITPAPGLLVAFPSTLAYRHEVKRVNRGNRDALAFWFTQEPTRAERWQPAVVAAQAAADTKDLPRVHRPGFALPPRKTAA